MSDGDLAKRRANLIEQKKLELDEVYDKHDSLLRELFHLQKFVTLIGFDPNVAKQEKSEVWEEFRAPYDLWDHSSSGPSSRRTRRAIHERRESMTVPTSETPATNRKRKPPGVERLTKKGSMPDSFTMSSTSILAPKRSLDTSKSHRAKVIKNQSFTCPVTQSVISRKRPFGEQDHEGEHVYSDFPRGSSPTATTNGVQQAVEDSSLSLSPKKCKQKQKRRQSLATIPFSSIAPAWPSPTFAPPQSSQDSSPGGTPLPKRIRLIVKPAPLPVLATHPDQLPRPAVFGGSLSKLLSSFALLEEGDDSDLVERGNAADPGIREPGYVTSGDRFERPKIGISWEEFDESVKADVELWERIREVRARGGLMCMRGWEIVRGEEDEPEGEEEGEEDVEAQAAKEGGSVEPVGGNGGQEQGEYPMETIEDTRNILEEESLDNVEATSTNQDQKSLEQTQAEGFNDLSIAVIPEGSPPNTLTTTSAINTNVSHTVKEDELSQAPGDSPTDLARDISPVPETTPTPTVTPGRTDAQPPVQVDLLLVDETMGTEPTELKEPVIEPLIPGPNETFVGLETLIPQPTTPDIIVKPSRPSTPSSTLSLPLPNLRFLPQSHYGTLLAAIPAHARRIKTVPQAYRHRPATLISRYWERLQGAADRLAAAEERRVRTGARMLARGVVAKAWKDAVAVIRLRRREQEEAERARQGRKHLAVILEQSSALLETQQEDLGLTHRPGGRSRSASSGRSRSRSSQIDEEDEEGSERPGDTEIEEGMDDEEGSSKMPLGQGSRCGSEVSEDDREVIGLEVDDPDVDVGDTTDIAAFTTEPADIQIGSPEDIIHLSEIFDPASDRDHDEMVVDEQDPHSPEILNVISVVEGVDVTRNQDIEDPRNVVVDAIVPQDQAITTNGHHTTNRASTPSTPPSTSAMQMVPSSIAPTPPVVRKLTLKLKSPEPAPKKSQRSSRRTLRMPEGGSDVEVDDLARDAEIPLEEIMRRYGFVGINEAGVDQSSTPHEPDSDDESEIQGQDEGHKGEDSQTAGALLGLENVQTPNEAGIRPPFLLRGTLRPYQQSGLEWLISGYVRGNNGILADEMGLGKTIQTIALLAHLACDRGIWGPHLIIVPTSVILNWEMEFKKFLPGFKVLSYYGSIKERKERRIGWNTEHSFNVVVTSYQLVLADQAIFRRKKWHYMILDEAHNIKNFKSQRWATLFSFNSERRLLLTGTPLQNNITELWSLLYFVQPDTANKQQFEEWFLETMRHAVEAGDTMDEQTRDTIDKLHTVLRPYILRRLKCDVEQQLPGKHEHIVYCRLSKRQRYLYDEFMSRAQTKETLAGGNFLSIVNCLMQLRKVCNHPDLFEVRPILTSFAIPAGQSAVADYEIKELLVRRRLLKQFDDDGFSLHNHSFELLANATESTIVAEQRATLTPSQLFTALDTPGEPPPKDLRTVAGNKRWREHQQTLETRGRRQRIEYINVRRNTRIPILGFEKLRVVRSMVEPLVPADILEQRKPSPDTKFGVARMIRSYNQREEYMGDIIDRFIFATPTVVALDVPRLSLPPLAPCNYSGDIALNPTIQSTFSLPGFDILHRASVKLQIAFPDSSLLQYDCGKLQELGVLLREKNAGGHRVLIFTQMTRVLDILEIFLNFHGYRYLRLDGSTKIEQRQVVTERFNVDNRIFAFIASSRSGGVGINLTGADTVIFYDSDYNPSMDRQCEDRAHRIGQTREVSIYRFISKHTVEEAMLRKANQKRLLDDIVIQQGEFDWRQVMVDDVRIECALAEVEDKVDADAAKMATGEEQRMDWDDFGAGEKDGIEGGVGSSGLIPQASEFERPARDEDEDEDEDGLGPIEKYMLRVVEKDWDFFG